jgi:hypothetical protein
VAARIVPSARRVEAEARMTLRHDRKRPLRFFLHRELRVLEARVNGQRAAVTPTAGALPYVKSAVAYRLATEGIPPKEPTTVAVRYAGTLPSRVAEVNGIDAQLVELAVYIAWYPIFEEAPRFTTDLQLQLPPGLRAISRGERSVEPGGGTRWRTERPGPDLALVASPAFERVARRGVSVWFTRGPRAHAERILELSLRTLEGYRRAFGRERGEQQLKLVLSPRDGWGYARPGLIVLSEQKVAGGVTDDAVLRETVHNVAHEIGHLWWSLADSKTRHDWLNEALAEYSALRASEDLFGPLEAAAWRERYLTHLEQRRPTAAIIDTPADSPFRYVNWYERGALFLDALEHRFGRGPLDRFLARLYAGRGEEPLTTGAFRRRLVGALGREARVEVDRWVHGRGLPRGYRGAVVARSRRLDEALFVTKKLETVYAYLEVKQKRYGFSYPELKRRYLDRVRRIRTDAAHRTTLASFLEAFHDGHLRLLLPGKAAATAGPAVTHRFLPGRILLTRIQRFSGARVAADLRRGLGLLRRARALVVDLRGNPGGNNRTAFDYVARLFSDPILLGKSSVKLSADVLARRPHYREIYPPDPARPGFARWREARIEPLARVSFAGPIAVLVDRGCYSSCESTALAFKQSGRARLYGEATGGGSANPMAVDLPHTRGKLQLPTWVFVKPDGELLEDNGVKPHVVAADPLAPALAEIRRALQSPR